MITASRLALAKACPGHAHLPHQDVSTPDAEAGTRRHKEWEDRINAGDIPEELDERWPGASWRSEVPFAFDVSTGRGRELPKGAPRDYSDARPFEVCGTADVVGRWSGELIVIDKKSFDRVPAAIENLQTGIAAVALSRAHKVDVVHVGIWYEVQPFDVVTFDVFDLDAMAIEIRRVVEHPSRELTEGAWCKHCPAQESCVKKQRLAIEVASGAAETRINLANLDDDEVAADAYDFANRLRLLLRRLDARLYARAGERPIALRGGKMFGRVVSQGNRQLDGRIAYDVIKELHGVEVADRAVTLEATQAGIEAALKDALPRGSATAAKAKVMMQLDARGGVKQRTASRIEEYSAPPAQLASVAQGAK